LSSFAQIVASLPSALIITDAAGRIRTLNPAAANMLGQQAAALEGRPAIEILPAELCVRLARGESCNNLPCTFQPPGTDSLPVEVSLTPIRGGATGWIIVATDISPRITAEAAIRESEERFRSFSSIASDWFWEMDGELRFSWFSETASDILGSNTADLIGKRRDELTLTDDLQNSTHWHTHLDDLARRRPFRNFEYRIRSGDSRGYRWVSISGDPVFDAQGAFQGYRGTGRHITARKETEAQLIEAKLLAEAASQTKSAFLANMSHEIRTPLNAVIGMTDMLFFTALTPQQHDYAETIRTSAEALLTLISDILDLSRVESGKLNMEDIDFDLHAVVEEATETLGYKAQQKGLEFVRRLAPDLPAALRGDPGRLRQILVNLAGNAVKFTQRGEIAVEVRMLEEEAERVRLHFEIRDTGIGIATNALPELFHPFTQADSSITRKFGGTGLGLSIAKHLVELMNGEIGVHSAAGQGSTFWFTVQFRKGRVKRRRTPRQPVSLQGLRVLVVDDNHTNCLLLLDLLERWGCRVSCVASGAAALTALDSAAPDERPQLALLDYQMPEMDGMQLARLMRSRPAGRSLKLVLLSSEGLHGEARLAQEAGFNALLSKPVEHDLLQRTLVEVLSGSKEGLVTRHSLVRQVNFAGYRVLLVEDNAVNRRVATALLQRLHLSVAHAENGALAIEMLTRERFDLVLMDIQMPVMDGYAATRVIRNPASPVLDHAVPIIALTANALPEDCEQSLQAGMNAHLTKPVDFNLLVEILAQWLDAAGEITPAGLAPSLIFDPDSVLERVNRDHELASAIVQGAIADLPECLKLLQQAMWDEDLRITLHAIHDMRALAAGAGGRSLADALELLASRVEEGDAEDARRRLGRIKKDLPAMLAALEQFSRVLARQSTM